MSKELRITEKESKYDNLEKKSIAQLTKLINAEDQTVAVAVAKALKQINKVIGKAVITLENNGRIIYMGAGTSGRLGILDASECPPTFGVNHNTVVGLIAGGDKAIRKAVENAEDSITQGWKDLEEIKISKKDFVIGIAASGSTPYVIHALKECNKNAIATACIVCNKKSELAAVASLPIEVVVGPEFVTGSTRMKSGTAQKMVLNMISTCAMIKIGRVKGNKMVDMQLTNKKLHQRAEKMLVSDLKILPAQAKELLAKHGSVRKAINHYLNSKK
jgi:N-acetylmuramic acid 6-phosphate etherase